MIRRIIGITGCPGAGKSMFAAGLAAERGPGAVVVPMDGFHIAHDELERLGRADRKGAPDTFDLEGYLSLLERIRADGASTIYAPAFDRRTETSLAGAIAVDPEHTTVITEGNYLLHAADGWQRVRPLLHECWYVECHEAVRIVRLLARHIENGRSGHAAAQWVHDVDEPNARLVRATRADADVVIYAEDGRLALPLPVDPRRLW